MTRTAGCVSPASQPVQGCRCPACRGWGCSCTPGWRATWQPGQQCRQLPACRTARAACPTYGETPLFSAISRLHRVSAEDLPLHPPAEVNTHVLFLQPLAGTQDRRWPCRTCAQRQHFYQCLLRISTIEKTYVNRLRATCRDMSWPRHCGDLLCLYLCWMNSETRQEMEKAIWLYTSWHTHEGIHTDVLACALMGGLWAC